MWMKSDEIEEKYGIKCQDRYVVSALMRGRTKSKPIYHPVYGDRVFPIGILYDEEDSVRAIREYYAFKINKIKEELAMWEERSKCFENTLNELGDNDD